MAITGKDIREHWMILAAFAAGLVAWGATTATLADAKDDVASVKQEVAAQNEKISKIQASVTAIETATRAQAAASAEAQRVNERQMDQLIEQLRRIEDATRSR